MTFGSTFFATLGIRAAQTHLAEALDRMGIPSRPKDYSLSRVDYCTDVLVPGFELDPEAFVMHSGTNRRDHIAGVDRAVNGRSGRVTSVTVGSTRARQVIIYDKGLEVTQKQKAHWWHIWNEGRAQRALPPRDPAACRHAIWRIEYRAGKDLLKDT